MLSYQSMVNDTLPKDETSSLLPRVDLVNKSRKKTLLVILIAGLCVLFGFNAGKHQSIPLEDIDASLMGDLSDLESLSLSYAELLDIGPDEQKVQLAAYNDYKGGMPMDEINIKYRTAVVGTQSLVQKSFFKCCLSSLGCPFVCTAWCGRAPCSAGPGCDRGYCANRGAGESGCRYQGLGNCCRSDSYGSKFWFWEPCVKD